MIHLRKIIDGMKHDRDQGGATTDSPYESCICCHYQTDQMKNQDVWERKYYVEGAGQLCKHCYEQVYSNIK